MLDLEKINESVEEHFKSINQMTSLHYAAEKGDQKTIRTLLKNGMDVNGKDDMGETPLHRTPHNDDIGVIQLLLENGADVNAR